MKPVRRRIRRHFGLTAKQVAVRSKRPWYFQWSITILYVVIGYALAYWQFADAEDVYQKLRQTAFENQTLHTKIIQVERQLQIEQAAQTSLTQELNKVQDENMHIKQDLFFYKNMTNGKRLQK
jgi:hypothetical protein